MKLLIVVDMQNDFVDGALGTPEARAILPAVIAKIKAYEAAGDEILFTLDTHTERYLETQEGKNLPVPHCIRGTEGWQIARDIAGAVDGSVHRCVEKDTFGSRDLALWLSGEARTGRWEEIELVGLCTDVCVISNALLIKAFLPEVALCVDARCCAGVTPEGHQTALAAMRACQIAVTGGE